MRARSGREPGISLARGDVDVNRGSALAEAAAEGHAEAVQLLLACEGIDVAWKGARRSAIQVGHFLKL